VSVVGGIREISSNWLWACLLAWPVVIVICFGILLPPATQVARATNGLVQPTLLFSALLFFVVIVGGIRLGGNLRGRDIGLSASKIPEGFTVTLGVWVVLQLTLLFVALLWSDSSVSLSRGFETGRWTTTLGLFAAQLLGNAFVEEAMFRGFLMPQVYLKLGGRRDQLRWRPMLWALLASQLGFALVHIPNLHRLGPPGVGPVGSFAMIFALGVFFALIYIRTANLFVGIGLHALINTPMPLVRPVVSPEVVVFVLALLVLALWPLLSHRGPSDNHAVAKSA
jgi:membrane protease YdiL (CAAX protease family)